MDEPARRSARLTVRHEHRGRYRYRSRLCACQHGRDHCVSVGRVCDWTVHRLAAPGTAANSAERRRVTYPSINRALTMWCDHPGTKAVAFLVNHVNRASHLRSGTNREPPPRPWRQAVLSMIPPAFWRWWDQRSVWPLGSPTYRQRHSTSA